MQESTQLLSASTDAAEKTGPSALTLWIVRQYARAYMPTLGGIVLN